MGALALACIMAQSAVASPSAATRCPASPDLQRIDLASSESIQRSVSQLARQAGAPPIAYALGRPDELDRLLRHGANPNQCLLGQSLLSLSMASNNIAQAQRLLTAGAHPDRPADAEGGTPLHTALAMGHYSGARLLLKHGADVSARTDGGTGALHHLAMAPNAEGRLELASELIRRGASVNIAVRSGATPLMAAVVSGDAELVDLFIRSGADRSARSQRGSTAADLARKKNRTDLLKLLEPESR